MREGIQLINDLAAEFPDSKQLMLFDSRVTIGCLGKGRSQAPSLNREVRLSIPNVVGYNFFYGVDFAPHPAECSG